MLSYFWKLVDYFRLQVSLLLLAICFFARVWRCKTLEQFMDNASLMLLGDIIYVLAAAFSGLFLVVGMASFLFRHNGVARKVWTLPWLWLMATTFWYCLVKVAQLHDLEIGCTWRGCQSITKLNGFSGFMVTYQWQPVGLWRCVWAVFWRPLHYLCSQTPMLARWGLVWLPPERWAQWREVLVGLVLWWCCLVFAVVMACRRAFAAAGGHSLACLLVVGSCWTIAAVYLAFLGTSDFMMSFWLFLQTPFAQLANIFAGHPSPKDAMHVEDWCALVLVVCTGARAGSFVVLATFGKWAAKQRREESLRLVLSQPFHAEFEESSWDMKEAGKALAGPEIGRHLAREQLKSLQEKRSSMVEARRRMLHDLAAEDHRELPRSLRFQVRRGQLLEDSCRVLFERAAEELLAPVMKVGFESEPGLDDGGLTRDWFDSFARALNEDAATGKEGLLATAPDSTLMPRPSTDSSKKLLDFIALGRFLALAVFREKPVPISISLLICKCILNVRVGVDDVRRLDNDWYLRRVEPLLQEGGLEVVNEQLQCHGGEPLAHTSAPTDFCWQPQELVEGGAQLLVTEDNKRHYLEKLCEHYLCGDIRTEIRCLLQGFWDLLPQELLEAHGVRPVELCVLISGVSDLDPLDWRIHSEHSEGTPQHNWFWEVVEAMDAERRCLLLHFATGSSRAPPGGFSRLSPRFCCEVTSMGSPEHLPHAHTCANKLVLHKYPSRDVLQEKLATAISSSKGFGFL